MLPLKNFQTDKDFKGYSPTNEETQKITYIKQRYNDMRASRTIVDRNWDTYQKMINAIFVPYPDERSSSVVPLASSMIELYVAEANKIETTFNFKAETSDYSTQAKALEYVWKYDWRRNKRKKAFVENEYITAGFGTSILYTGFESCVKEQFDPIVGDDFEIKWERKQVRDDKIVVKNIDIRNFYIDNQAITSIDEASDCIFIQWISYEKFKGFKNSKIYKNIDKVTPRNYSNDNAVFVTEEDTTKKGDFIKLTHYWNVETDSYVILANDNVIIREHPMTSTIDGKKALPFIIRVLGKKNYSIYGRGLCEALLMFNSEVNNLRELLMDAIRRSNVQVLALGRGLTFNDRGFSYDNEILTFDGDLAGNFQQLSGNPPNQAIFSYLTQLYKDIAIYVGIDIQNIIGQPQQTAFQTEVQREASQKRINVWLVNRDLAYERFADLYKDLLQTYFPRKTAEGIYPKIEIEGEELRDNGDKKVFRKKKGKSIFEVTPELLRGDIYIDVHTNTTAPTINAVDRQQKLDLLNSIAQISNGYAIAKQSGIDVESILPIKQTLSDLASDYNINVSDKSDETDVKEAKMKLINDLKGMMGGGLIGQQEQQSEQQPEQQQLQQEPII